MATRSETHDLGAQRLSGALAEQDRLTSRFARAVGTADELAAGVELHAADRQVVARDAWLKWVDDEGYRGMNAGPFALRQELEHALAPSLGAARLGQQVEQVADLAIARDGVGEREVRLDRVGVAPPASRAGEVARVL
ncbi:MAG: hypothetical protein QOD53_1287 [Thermoleophilaceae bacterium]|nr:hypothetical protein [Thermoleophilaceae bacterium]